MTSVFFRILSRHNITNIKSFGGVVPEIAARAHLTHIESIIQEAFHEANVSLLTGLMELQVPGVQDSSVE